MIPMCNLYNIIVEIFKAKKWELFQDPDLIFTGYQLEPNNDRDIYRDDILSGYTSNINLINSYLDGNGDSINYVQSVGADYIFLVYNHLNVPQEQKVSYRADIEDELVSLLSTHKLGYHLGGATGIYNSYIDMLIFDIDEFNRQVGNVLQKYDVKINCVPFSIFVKED